jgi:hypothetical protein
MARRAASPQAVISHWYYLIDSLQTSTLDFYTAVEQAIARRAVPNAKTARVDYKEGGVLSAKREYLRVRRKGLLFDICGAPFGRGFFVSWWLGERSFLTRLLELPVVGAVLGFLVRPWTYFKIDTALMFQETIREAVNEVIDGLTNAQGLRALTEFERKPILRDFYRR